MESVHTNTLSALSEAMVQAVARAGMSTVRVDARKGVSSSGTAYQSGWILAANHAVEHSEDIRVELPNGSMVQARLAGRDTNSDLCLLKLDGDVAIPGSPAPEEAQVGQIVLALGRPTEEGIQASMGVVGAVGGPLQINNGGFLDRFIRTDAIPYPGFSGGPLVDGDGQILGVNTSGFAPGASLAIPVKTAWQVAQALSRNGHVRRGFLGIRSQVVDLPADAARWLGRSQNRGLLLVGIERGHSADQAGLMVGDILVGLNGRRIENQDSLMQILAGDIAGTATSAEVLRGGRRFELPIRISERQ